MKKPELIAMLQPVVNDNRKHSYAYWLRHVVSTDPIVTYPISGEGTKCCIEISAFWDDQPNGDIRVAFSIDDGGWRSLMPVGIDFIIASDDTFAGE